MLLIVLLAALLALIVEKRPGAHAGITGRLDALETELEEAALKSGLA